MGRQYNKVIKRRRRARHLKRKQKAAKAKRAVAASGKPAKS
jgi:hypothetical protein